MVSSRRVTSGALIFVMATYLFFLRNDAFSVSLFSDAANTFWYYMAFAMLGATMFAGFLIYKDLLLGGILAICCTGFLVVIIIRGYVVYWVPGIPWPSDVVIQHFHTVIIDLIMPALMLAFGFAALGKGRE
ncbi:MAG: hypothetical protein HWN65_14075 [Candidatus Helarchaeota archaeon]|nr:hypothetical protein [Candidatus Helarchaeota archaeon]